MTEVESHLRPRRLSRAPSFRSSPFFPPLLVVPDVPDGLDDSADVDNDGQPACHSFLEPVLKPSSRSVSFVSLSLRSEANLTSRLSMQKASTESTRRLARALLESYSRVGMLETAPRCALTQVAGTGEDTRQKGRLVAIKFVRVPTLSFVHI